MSARPSADGYEPRFDIDYERGSQGEMFTRSIIDAMARDRVEVKQDGRIRETGNVYLEYECLRRGKYVPSGLATSEAECWVFVIEGGDVLIAIPTEKLKELGRAAFKAGNVRECVVGSHPTKGVVVTVADLLGLGTRAGKAVRSS